MAILLALTVIFSSVCAVNVFASNYSDTYGYWASTEIDKWYGYGVIQGSDGKFRPNDNITRAEVAQVTQNVIGYVDQAANTFSDIDTNAWYAPAVLKLAAGTLAGDAAGTMRPNDNMTREEAMTMLCRAFNVTPLLGYLSNFSDAYAIASYAVDPINALASHNYISGYNIHCLELKLLHNLFTLWWKWNDSTNPAYGASEGTHVIIKISPNTGYSIDTVTCENESTGGSVTVYESSNDEYYFTMPATGVDIAVTLEHIAT